jgi:alpha-galactosidase/6-phospho-beta-glucosidase family protein
MIKIAMIGAGSAGFCGKLVQDVLQFEELADAHFALMDVDGGRLKTTLRVMERMKEQQSLRCGFSATTSFRESLTDANFAISMIQVGGLEPYESDIKIPLRYGVDQCVGDPLSAAVLAPHEIRNMVDELFAAQKRWLPQFKGKRPTAPGYRIHRLPNKANSLGRATRGVKSKAGHCD